MHPSVHSSVPLANRSSIGSRNSSHSDVVRWRRAYSGFQVNETRRSPALEDEDTGTASSSSSYDQVSRWGARTSRVPTASPATSASRHTGSEALDERVLGWLAGLDVAQVNVPRVAPGREGEGRQFRSVVPAQMLRRSMQCDELFEDGDHAQARRIGIASVSCVPCGRDTAEDGATGSFCSGRSTRACAGR